MSRRRVEKALGHLLRFGISRRLAARVAAGRGRSLALTYHRLVEDPSIAALAVSPAVSPSLFRRHLQALADVGDIVPLRKLLDPATGSSRPRFAVTFDDDDPAHVELALPALIALGVHATFFLSGRALHGLAPYWWSVLERAVIADGLASVCRQIGVATPGRATELAATIESQPVLRQRIMELRQGEEIGQLGADGIRHIAQHGMEIGFHTLHHHVLTTLPDSELDSALLTGRQQLAAVVGRTVELLAYPHGRADYRVAARASAAGYTAGFVGGGRPIAAHCHRLLLGRWEPGPLRPAAFRSGAVLRLHRSTAVQSG